MIRDHAVVVGGSRGIGRAVACRLVADGYDVSVLSRTPPQQPHKGITYRSVDVTDAAACIQVFEDLITVHGAPQRLVLVQRYRGQQGDPWGSELEVAVAGSRRLIDLMSAQMRPGAAIVLVSSVNAWAIDAKLPLAYHVAKASLNQMARYYAVYLGARGIRVNTVSPATVIKSESSQYFSSDAENRRPFESATPLGRMGTAEEVAAVVAFLCGPDSAFVTGQNIVVDGGASLEWQESLAARLLKKQDARNS